MSLVELLIKVFIVAAGAAVLFGQTKDITWVIYIGGITTFSFGIFDIAAAKFFNDKRDRMKVENSLKQLNTNTFDFIYKALNEQIDVLSKLYKATLDKNIDVPNDVPLETFFSKHFYDSISKLDPDKDAPLVKPTKEGINKISWRDFIVEKVKSLQTVLRKAQENIIAQNIVTDNLEAYSLIKRLIQDCENLVSALTLQTPDTDLSLVLFIRWGNDNLSTIERFAKDVISLAALSNSIYKKHISINPHIWREENVAPLMGSAIREKEIRFELKGDGNYYLIK